MPKPKKIELSIPAFYRRQAIDILLFGHVTALLPEKTIREAVYNFIETYSIDPADYDIDTALVVYNNMKQKFLYAQIKGGHVPLK